MARSSCKIDAISDDFMPRNRNRSRHVCFFSASDVFVHFCSLLDDGLKLSIGSSRGIY